MAGARSLGGQKGGRHVVSAQVFLTQPLRGPAVSRPSPPPPRTRGVRCGPGLCGAEPPSRLHLGQRPGTADGKGRPAGRRAGEPALGARRARSCPALGKGRVSSSKPLAVSQDRDPRSSPGNTGCHPCTPSPAGCPALAVQLHPSGDLSLAVGVPPPSSLFCLHLPHTPLQAQLPGSQPCASIRFLIFKASFCPAQNGGLRCGARCFLVSEVGG